MSECQCGRAVFFRNSQCLNCSAPLAYEPHLGKVVPLVPGPYFNVWQIAGHAGVYTRCGNLNTSAACNWLVSDGQTYCLSCRLTRTIPDQSIPENRALWGRLEDAKRRVISALISLRLPLDGMAFDFLRSPENGPRVMTGHLNGLITINIEEADDLKREQIRTSMHEPYRTLVGHFRHEVGHYYWSCLIAYSSWLRGFRALFGDERADYQTALQTNYRQGPNLNWPAQYISAYASIHPWEDWAETWAHYMHMIDTLGAAISLGLKPETIQLPFDPFGPDVLYETDQADSERFLSFLNAWLKLTAVMNELCRSMGQPDFYPFALPRLAVTKLHFVHMVVTSGANRLTTAS